MGTEIYALAIGAGALAGVINTLAGSGSLITLWALMAMGLPATVANGTNRIGVIIQTAVGMVTMRAHGTEMPEGLGWMVVSTTVGAIGGAWLATTFDPEALEWVIIGVLWLTLVALFFKPKEWLRQKNREDAEERTWRRFVVMGLVGAWGGFLQAGVGILLLVALVLIIGRDVIEATAIKLVVVFVYSVVTLPIFLAADQVYWTLGLLVGLGQAVGGWMGARFAATSPEAPKWIRRLLVVMIVVAAVDLMLL